MEIGAIRIEGLLPDVFRGDDAAVGGDVWLRDITFERGRLYRIEAESGAGKSSLCSFIYGNRSDYQGTIRFDGADIRSFSIDRWCSLRRRSLALMPQEMRIFPELTALENVLIKNSLTDFMSLPDIQAMFSRLGIDDKVDSLAAHLSIGQQQRVALIRTLCQPADFIILDEPVSHLDSRNNAIVAEMVVQVADRLGAAVITTSVGNHLMLPPDRTTTLHL